MLKSLKYAGLFPALLITILVITSTWIDSLLSTDTNKDRHVFETNRQKYPDYQIDNFEMITLDQTGILKNKLSAKKLEHYNANNRLVLIQPHFLQLNLQKEMLTISAQKGELLPNQEDYRFYNNVHIIKESPLNPKDYFNVASNELYIYPKLNKIYSPVQSSIHAESISTQAGNFIYQHDLKLINLGSNVKTTYNAMNKH